MNTVAASQVDSLSQGFGMIPINWDGVVTEEEAADYTKAVVHFVLADCAVVVEKLAGMVVVGSERIWSCGGRTPD